MNNEEQELVVVAHNLPENKVQGLLSSYKESMAKAKEIVSRARQIVVTSEDQVEEMQLARKTRLELKDVRCHVENIRVELKEQSLREGKAIDGMANIIKAIIVPVEEYLEKQEKYVFEQKKIREDEELQRRTDMLSPYVSDVSVYSLHPTQMSKETFDKLMEDSKKAYEAQKAAEKRAEEERIANEKKQKEENERIRKENEKLREQNRIKNEKLKAEREKTEAAEQKLREEKALQERKDREAKLAQEAKDKAELEEKHKKEMAPDREKLLELANHIQLIQFPPVSSIKAKGALERLEQRLGAVIAQLREEANSL
jgi:hypothetical protein